MTSLHDARRRSGSPAEASLAQRMAAAVLVTVETWCAARAAEDRAAGRGEYKRTVYKRELADVLGVTLRSLDRYGYDVPIPLPKAVLLAAHTGHDAILQAFAECLGCVAVPLPDSDLADLEHGVQELYRNQKEFTEFHAACVDAAGAGSVPPELLSRLVKEGRESIAQTMRWLVAAGHGALPGLFRGLNRQQSIRS